MKLHGPKLLHDVPADHWARQTLDGTPHKASDLLVYFLKPNLQYIERCYELRKRAVEMPEIKVEANGTGQHGLMVPVSDRGAPFNEVLFSRAQVADAVNRWWVRDAAAKGWAVADMYLLEPDLSVPRISVSPHEKLVIEALDAGKVNPWIAEAWDPPFDIKQVVQAPNLAALEWFFIHGNWCLGSTILYGDLAFMNQVDGGDEWLVMRRGGLVFESYSFQYALGQDRDCLKRFIADAHAASDLELRGLKYSEAATRKPQVNAEKIAALIST